MDLTALARRLLEPIPANKTLGLRVLRAADGAAEVTAGPAPGFANVIGSMHSSGLVALLDAAGLAAVIAAARDEAEFDGVVPLGFAAEVRFLAPARGKLVAGCALGESATELVRTLFDGTAAKIRLATTAEITDEQGTAVCSGEFRWSVRRQS
ncbi:DUF4442 domain-containing protein [Amycolatopsis sp. 195334CR]|uniref:DUF4442 domain-containing protein n=1 Tax=Amycolatopsis sp. 195334CR TaxID=2814588 RepID=UPI001A8C87E3|nr:DUF4442 domain-containing protein [Amycolatopsis sp. 195334CR]MBN6041855.1 DUF4442 domain-containing protein [Amycolatopsis sp. 195334CR]